MHRTVIAALVAALLLVLAVPASAHTDDDAGLYQPARRDHFVEHLLISTLILNPGARAHIEDHAGEGCFTDLGATRAQTDLDSDGDIDAADDGFLREAICDGKIHGAVRGYADGSFGPTDATERDQGASFVCRSVALLDGPGGLGLDGHCLDQQDTQYSDVREPNPHSGAVFHLSNGSGPAGFDPPIFQGFEDGLFKPADSVKNRHPRLIGERIVDNLGDDTDE